MCLFLYEMEYRHNEITLQRSRERHLLDLSHECNLEQLSMTVSEKMHNFNVYLLKSGTRLNIGLLRLDCRSSGCKPSWERSDGDYRTSNMYGKSYI